MTLIVKSSRSRRDLPGGRRAHPPQGRDGLARAQGSRPGNRPRQAVAKLSESRAAPHPRPSAGASAREAPCVSSRGTGKPHKTVELDKSESEKRAFHGRPAPSQPSLGTPGAQRPRAPLLGAPSRVRRGTRLRAALRRLPEPALLCQRRQRTRDALKQALARGRGAGRRNILLAWGGAGVSGAGLRTVSPPGAPAGPGRCTQSVQPSHLCHMPGATMRGQQWAILPDLGSRPCSGGKGRGRGGGEERLYGSHCTSGAAGRDLPSPAV